jgi:hypothetical protein
MTGELAHDTIAMTLTVLLNGIADVAYALAHNGLFDAEVKGFLRDAEQLADLRGDLTYTERIG